MTANLRCFVKKRIVWGLKGDSKRTQQYGRYCDMSTKKSEVLTNNKDFALDKRYIEFTMTNQWVFFMPASTSTNFSKGAFSRNIS